MRIGLIGGTFDPIHLGHLRAAELAREALDLAIVLFVPSGSPPHRQKPRSSDLDRYAMTCLAIQGHPQFQVSDLELMRAGPSYTVETVAALNSLRPEAELFLIVGSDAFAEMDSWKNLERLTELCRVAVVQRPCAETVTAKIAACPWSQCVPGEGLPITSTEVRKAVQAGRSVRYLVPEAVAEHIQRRRLYR
jgi:nicotinate-nucleotide adenylyltransferase